MVANILSSIGSDGMNFAVHIGFSKAASTYLQSTIFSGAHAEIGLLDKSENKLLNSAWKPQKNRGIY